MLQFANLYDMNGRTVQIQVFFIKRQNTTKIPQLNILWSYKLCVLDHKGLGHGSAGEVFRNSPSHSSLLERFKHIELSIRPVL